MKYINLIESYISDMEVYSDETNEQLVENVRILKGGQTLLLESTNPLLTLEGYKKTLSKKEREIVDDFMVYCKNI
jgi:hypothetical protein